MNNKSKNLTLTSCFQCYMFRLQPFYLKSDNKTIKPWNLKKKKKNLPGVSYLTEIQCVATGSAH